MARTRESAGLERLVLDTLPIGVYAVDLDGRITVMNRSAARGAAPKGAAPLADAPPGPGSSLWDVIRDPATRAQMEQAMASLREGRATSLSWETTSTSPAGDRAVLVQVSALGDTRTVNGYSIATVDITPNHRASEGLVDAGLALANAVGVDRVLQETSQQLRSGLTCALVAIALADEDSTALQLVHHSGTAEEGDAIEERLAPVWSEAVASGQAVVRTAGDATEITVPMRSGEGVLGTVTVSSAGPLPAQRLDETRRLVATITSQAAAAVGRARLVRRMVRKRQLEAVGEVSAAIAHELRNPLFGISSAAQLLRFRIKDDPVVEKSVGRILREVERLNTLAASLLEYGRPGPIRLETGDPDAVWDEVLQTQRGLLESRALLLQRSRAEPAARCAIDAQQLSQVMVNLLANAAEAAPEGTDLMLHSTVLPSGAWRCRLQNGGAPIPDDVLPRVFEIFFSTKPGGAGIGLALCQRIIEQHGGTIALESAADRGTVATIVLPPAV